MYLLNQIGIIFVKELSNLSYTKLKLALLIKELMQCSVNKANQIGKNPFYLENLGAI